MHRYIDMNIMDIEDFKNWIKENHENSNDNNDNDDEKIVPSVLATKERAFREAEFLMNDMKWLANDDPKLSVVVFEYEDGYQVDVESSKVPSFQIYSHIYKPEDIQYVYMFDEDKCPKRLNVS